MENVLKLRSKSVLIPLGLTTAASEADEGTHKIIIGSGTITLIISNEEMEDTKKIVKSLKESSLLIIVASETIKNNS